MNEDFMYGKLRRTRKAYKVISGDLRGIETKGIWHIDKNILNKFKNRGTLEELDVCKRLVNGNKAAYSDCYCFVIDVDIYGRIADNNLSNGIMFRTKKGYLDFISRLDTYKDRIIYAKYLF